MKRIGILTLTGYRFGVNTSEQVPPPIDRDVNTCGIHGLVRSRSETDKTGTGIVGSLAWHDISIESGRVGLAIGRAVEILSEETPPPGRVGCEWCAFYQQLGVDVTKLFC